nr:autophagy-related protein 18b-like isoform X2 [Ziziphus jujuba var. spinosa]
MANQSYPILCASFNQDFSLFAIATRDGFKIFDSSTGRLCYEQAIGAFTIVEMLFSSSLLAIVGAGEQPSLSPRRLCLFNTTTGHPLRELNFLTSILAVRMNRKSIVSSSEVVTVLSSPLLKTLICYPGKCRLVVLLQEKTYVYDINSLTILDTIDTAPNLKGLCAFSPSLDGCFLALPACTTRGSVLLYNVMELQSHCEIDAHRAPLVAMVLSSNGMYIATASEQGTIIRVHSVSEATKSYSFRRGTYPSTIFSLSFGPSMEIPEILVATSSSGSVHAFSLGLGISQRSRRSNSFLGSMMLESVTDALDPAHHNVLHNAAPAGVKSYAVIRKVDKITDPSISETLACRVTISILTYNGYFQDYILSINNQDEFLWSLARGFNLLLDDAICS